VPKLHYAAIKKNANQYQLSQTGYVSYQLGYSMKPTPKFLEKMLFIVILNLMRFCFDFFN
jgi:hypothetical protein